MTKNHNISFYILDFKLQKGIYSLNSSNCLLITVILIPMKKYISILVFGLMAFTLNVSAKTVNVHENEFCKFPESKTSLSNPVNIEITNPCDMVNFCVVNYEQPCGLVIIYSMNECETKVAGFEKKSGINLLFSKLITEPFKPFVLNLKHRYKDKGDPVILNSFVLAKVNEPPVDYRTTNVKKHLKNCSIKQCI